MNINFIKLSQHNGFIMKNASLILTETATAFMKITQEQLRVIGCNNDAPEIHNYYDKLLVFAPHDIARNGF